MNYQTFIREIEQYNPVPTPVNFLVSGDDSLIRDTILCHIYEMAKEKGRTLIILDDTDTKGVLNQREINAVGYHIENGLDGYYIYNPLQISNIKDMSRLRKLLNILGYDEKRKMKVISYLNFIKHIEILGKDDSNVRLTLKMLGEYSSSMLVEMKLQRLLSGKIIDEDEHQYLLGKYAEVCEAAADFEDMLFLLAPYIDDAVSQKLTSDDAIVYPLGELKEDLVFRNMIVQLLLFALEEEKAENITVVILDKGYGDRRCLFDFLTALPSNIDMHIVSRDVWGLCDDSVLPTVFNRFSARIYGRHLAAASCQAIEKFYGDIDVVKSSYTESYDRRWGANRPWDILMGKNKTETYILNAPIRQPKYRKEMIAGFLPGTGIVEYMGKSSLFFL